jgi:hypothetical protein
VIISTISLPPSQKHWISPGACKKVFAIIQMEVGEFKTNAELESQNAQRFHPAPYATTVIRRYITRPASGFRSQAFEP